MQAPTWIAEQPFVRKPPFYGDGSSDLLSGLLVSLDTETLLAPTTELSAGRGKPKHYWRRKALRVVIATLAGRGQAPEAVSGASGVAVTQGTAAWKALVPQRQVGKVVSDLLEAGATLVLHNSAFDMASLCAKDYRLLRLFFLALAEGRVVDTMIREMLIAIATGQMQDEGRGSGGGFSLAALSEKYLGKDRSAQKSGPDVWRLRYHELDGVPLDEWPEAAKDYALEDATDTLLIAIAQAPIGAGNERRSFDGFPFTTPRGGVVNEIPQTCAAWALYLQSAWGMRVDPDLYEKWGKDIAEKVTFAEDVARAAGFLRDNGSVDTKVLKALVEADLAKRGIGPDHPDYPRTEPSKTFPDGQLKTDKDTLLGCKATEITLEIDGKAVTVKPLKEWGEAGFMRKMQSTYYEPAGMGREYAMLYTLNVLVATGRTSGRMPNMQNPPRKGLFRELFIPRPGMLFCSTDYSSLELRTLAQIHMWFLGSSALRDAFLEGKDPHEIVGAEIAGMSLGDFQALKHTDPKKYKLYRQCSKVINFGLPGGLGVESLISFAWTSYGVDIYESAIAVGFAEPVEGVTEQHAVAARFAKKLITDWRATWPEAGEYMQLVGDACETAGRKFDYLQPVAYRVRGDCGYCDGSNTGFQGLAADGAKEAAWRLAVMCYLEPADAMAVFEAQGRTWGRSIWPDDVPAHAIHDAATALCGVRPVLFIHDEVLSEGPEATAHVWAPAQGRVLVETMRMYTPDVPQEAEPALQRRWLKDADPTYDNSGKLIPWEPKP